MTLRVIGSALEIREASWSAALLRRFLTKSADPRQKACAAPSTPGKGHAIASAQLPPELRSSNRFPSPFSEMRSRREYWACRKESRSAGRSQAQFRHAEARHI